MTDNEYLQAVLREQTIAPGSEEFKVLQEQREAVEGLLRDEYGSAPKIREGGSKAKNTMIRESYDLDVLCYFPFDEDASLEDLYNGLYSLLTKSYGVERKRSALRLTELENDKHYVHIDVVPGRYTDDSETDVFLHQENGDKERLKTNPDVHISHIRDSGVRYAIKLMKLWNVRNGVGVKTFVLELLVVDLLTEKKDDELADQLTCVLKSFRDDADSLSVVDPANPQGNDLSDLLNDSVKSRLSSAAATALDAIEREGWRSVFGELKEDEDGRQAALRNVARNNPSPNRPWSNDERTLV